MQWPSETYQTFQPDGTITLDWYPPEVAGAALPAPYAYQVDWIDPNGDAWAIGPLFCSAPDGINLTFYCSFVFPSYLAIDAGPYEFWIESLNQNEDTSNNTSAPSNPVEAYKATSGAPPSPPTNVSATAGNAEATVSWSPPTSDGSSAVTSFTVTASPGPQTATVNGSTTTATVTGLTNGVSYSFTVTATNQYGTSASSNPSNSVTPSGGPNAPNDVQALGENGQADISWVPPTSNGGTSIDSYLIQAYTSSGYIGETSACGNCTSATYPGILDGTTYSFAVYAHNAAGYGAPGWSNTITPGAGGSGALGGCPAGYPYGSSPSTTGCHTGITVNPDYNNLVGIYTSGYVAQLTVPTSCGAAEYVNSFTCWSQPGAPRCPSITDAMNEDDYVCGADVRPVQLAIVRPAAAHMLGDFIGVGYMAGCFRSAQNADPNAADHCTGYTPAGNIYKRIYYDWSFNGTYQAYMTSTLLSAGDGFAVALSPYAQPSSGAWQIGWIDYNTTPAGSNCDTPTGTTCGTFDTPPTEAYTDNSDCAAAGQANNCDGGYGNFGAENSEPSSYTSVDGHVNQDMAQSYQGMQTTVNSGSSSPPAGWSGGSATSGCSGSYGGNTITEGGSC